MSDRVGIVILVYNKADIAVACLRSLVFAKSSVPFEVYVLDNASRLDESEKVKAELDRHRREGRLQGVFVRSVTNHGYPRGNNFGIKHFLGRGGFSHICLLNSDVVVTDHWLDRLVAKNADAIGPITNACGNEQTVPIPFSIAPTDEGIEAANVFARERWRTYEGFTHTTRFLGFFCFLARVELFCVVGFLDEAFGRGAYEDDDYCIRMLRAGYSLVVARDVFVYHWGGASFGQLSGSAFRRSLRANRRRLEEKYGEDWHDRSVLPLHSVWLDMNYRLSREGSALAGVGEFAARMSTDWVGSLLASERTEWARRSVRVLAAKWVEGTALSKAWKILRMLVKGRPVVFPVRYPLGDDLKDGYFQRVKLVDESLQDHYRVYMRYVDGPSARCLLPRVSKKTHRVYELEVERRNPVQAAIAAGIGIALGRVYVHSVLRLNDPLARFLYRGARIRVFDAHGAVPEEFRYHDDEINAKRYGDLERWAVTNASLVVVVTQTMREHLESKYGAANLRATACLSMLPRTGRWTPSSHDLRLRDGIIYAGGLHKWQQVDKMLELVSRDGGRHRFTFLVPDPEALKRLYRERYGGELFQTVTSAPSTDVPMWYERNSLGLILRERIIVNAVACPTKLVEYLQYGLVPIVDSPEIGDFPRYGYRYVSLNAPFPDVAAAMEIRRANYEVLKKMYLQFLCGLEELRSALQASARRPAAPAGEVFYASASQGMVPVRAEVA